MARKSPNPMPGSARGSKMIPSDRATGRVHLQQQGMGGGSGAGGGIMKGAKPGRVRRDPSQGAPSKNVRRSK